VVGEILGEIPAQGGNLVEMSMGGMVWSGREWRYGVVSLIEVRYDGSAGACILTASLFRNQGGFLG